MLQKDHVNRMDLENNKYKITARKKLTPGSDMEETATVWTYLYNE